jgi:hypothetical protein
MLLSIIFRFLRRLLVRTWAARFIAQAFRARRSRSLMEPASHSDVASQLRAVVQEVHGLPTDYDALLESIGTARVVGESHKPNLGEKQFT